MGDALSNGGCYNVVGGELRELVFGLGGNGYDVLGYVRR